MSAAAITRLLAEAPTDRPMSLDEHLDLYGPASEAGEDPRMLIETVERSGLRGRGGADFPTATKLRAVATAQRLPVGVANGVEGEPLSAKDKVVLAAVPHLVIDGAVLAAQAVGAEDVLLCVADDAREVGAAVDAALAERDSYSPDHVRVRLERVPNRYLTGEESALVHLINGGPAKPTFIPPRPFERGVRGRPTLVQNVETLAHVAQIARWGAGWFRELGTALDPGSALVTLSGAVRRPGVYEIECEATLRDIVALAGGPAEPLEAFLIGGYFGSWFDAERALSLRLGHYTCARRADRSARA
jgi:NADH:ubiquinone oxidoreductase subunit F (NADH-binding)